MASVVAVVVVAVVSGVVAFVDSLGECELRRFFEGDCCSASD